MQRWFTRCASIAAALSLPACSGSLDAPSAYADQVYVCDGDGAAAREAWTMDCRERASCAGWVSFRGMLQDQPVTVGAPLDVVELGLISVAGLGLVRDDLELRGNSPYFRLRWALSDLPPLRQTPGQVEYRVTISGEEDSIKSSLRLNGGGASIDLPARDGVVRTKWDAREQDGEAHLEFGGGNVIDGCFFARASLEPSR